MERIKVLQEILEGKGFTFIDLDNIMMEYGYYSVMDDGWDMEIIDSQDVVYTNTTTNECEIRIFFENLTDASNLCELEVDILFVTIFE